MTIAAVLRGKGATIETITAEARVYDAVRKLGEKRIGALPVLGAGEIAGIISERDVIYCLRDHGPEVLHWPVRQVMSSPAITIDPDTDVLAALALMTQRRIRHLPIVEGGEIRGIVSIGDLVNTAWSGLKPRPTRCAPTSRAPDPLRKRPRYSHLALELRCAAPISVFGAVL
jgi:CBS domain-containing protein